MNIELNPQDVPWLISGNRLFPAKAHDDYNAYLGFAGGTWSFIVRAWVNKLRDAERKSSFVTFCDLGSLSIFLR